ncbi:MAG: Gfo/Idh/MocA family oxidoreductase [Candidatus Sumerlaeia bacterium]|nr:Gfo/Idh/MocA family oxidoreductase [Candidatus Sumerlaeia bacterium]
MQSSERGDLSSGLSRRALLQGAGAAAAGFVIVPRRVLGGPGYRSPGQTLTLAGVGIGGVGFPQMQSCEKAGFQVVALCDVDDHLAAPARRKWPQARTYRDFREMFDAEGDKVDAVYIGTPDHTHAVITAAALRRNKHVCCVKPLARTLHELQTVVEAARRAGVATQVTAAPNTNEASCRLCELLWAGAIGQVREVHVWSDRPIWPQGMTRPAGEDSIPGHLDWDLWIGPAPMRPFKDKWPEGHSALAQIKANKGKPPLSTGVYHPFNFRGWWDFGTGALGDMGCHIINPVYRALKLDHPTRIQATSTLVLEESAPLASIVTYDFPARDDRKPVRVVWYDGGLKPPCPQELAGRPLPNQGALFIGSKGKMLGSEILPVSRAKQFANVPKTLTRRPGTFDEWFEACNGGEPAGCHFDWAELITEFVLLGNIALRTGMDLKWNPAKRRFTGSGAEEANAWIRPPYREGWTL